uniref:Uncharacterized protein n=1 Tax=Plectus sambesii TaxID=2011161 RepID=A0A914X1S5_9BILA
MGPSQQQQGSVPPLQQQLSAPSSANHHGGVDMSPVYSSFPFPPPHGSHMATGLSSSRGNPLPYPSRQDVIGMSLPGNFGGPQLSFGRKYPCKACTVASCRRPCDVGGAIKKSAVGRSLPAAAALYTSCGGHLVVRRRSPAWSAPTRDACAVKFFARAYSATNEPVAGIATVDSRRLDARPVDLGCFSCPIRRAKTNIRPGAQWTSLHCVALSLSLSLGGLSVRPLVAALSACLLSDRTKRRTPNAVLSLVSGIGACPLSPLSFRRGRAISSLMRPTAAPYCKRRTAATGRSALRQPPAAPVVVGFDAPPSSPFLPP